MGSKIIGMEIGQNQIKIVEASRHSAYYKIHKCSIIDVPRGYIENGMITEMELVAQLLENTLKKEKYHAKKVIAVVRCGHTISRKVMMRKQTEQSLRQLLEVQPERFLPIERHQYQVDFRILREIESEVGTQVEVQMVAVPNEVIFSTIHLIKSLKCSLIGVSVPSEALIQLFASKMVMGYTRNENILVLDMSANDSSIILINEVRGVLIRSIPFGIEHIQATICEVLSELKEGNQKQEYLFTNMICPQIECHILSEIERVLKFFYIQGNVAPIQKIYLLGEATKIADLRVYIRDALNIPTEVIDQLDKVRVAPSVDFEEQVNSFVYALGAISNL
ncbi:MAG: hypothetical protein E7231_04220 [Cellulosilyticum sp.]|nr:hypothetical protein [Cellulosilyticum sp.]